MLEWLGYNIKDNLEITSLHQWADFTRRVCYFHNQGSADLFKLILPSDEALRLHVSRGSYVLQMAVKSCDSNSELYKILPEGWVEHDGKVKIKWDENIDEIRKELRKRKKSFVRKCGCKSGKCSGEGRGCNNCCKQCKPCNQQCTCKGICSNPYNNGGTCSKCKIASTHDHNLHVQMTSQTNSPYLTVDYTNFDSHSDCDSISDASSEDEVNDQVSDFNTYFVDDDDTNTFLKLPPQSGLHDHGDSTDEESEYLHAQYEDDDDC